MAEQVLFELPASDSEERLGAHRHFLLTSMVQRT